MSILRYSSLFFMTNSITAYWVHDYLYSFLFGMLTITSVIHHTNYTIYTKLIDQVFVVSITVHGGNLLYQYQYQNQNQYQNQYQNDTYSTQLQIRFIETAFMICVFLFYYGYY